MALPVELVNPAIVAFLGQIQAAVCEAQKMGLRVVLDRRAEFTMEIIAPQGVNSIERISVSQTGAQETTVANPARTERQETDQAVSTSVVSASETISTATRIEPVQTVTRTAKPRTSTSQKSGTASVAETTESQSSEQTTARINSGGNTITRGTDYQSI